VDLHHRESVEKPAGGRAYLPADEHLAANLRPIIDRQPRPWKLRAVQELAAFIIYQYEDQPLTEDDGQRVKPITAYNSRIWIGLRSILS
jgi:hypothetical protein